MLIKFLKFKLTFLLAIFSYSFSFAEFNDSEYQALIEFAKEATFSKFKKVYDKKALSNEQYSNLLRIINEVIETNKNKWPKFLVDWDKIQDIKFFKLSYEKFCFHLPILSLLTFICIGAVPIINYVTKIILNSTFLEYTLPHKFVKHTAAERAHALDNILKKGKFLKYVYLAISFWGSLEVALMIYLVKFLKQILPVYKKLKKATKIKVLLEGN